MAQQRFECPLRPHLVFPFSEHLSPLSCPRSWGTSRKKGDCFVRHRSRFFFLQCCNMEERALFLAWPMTPALSAHSVHCLKLEKQQLSQMWEWSVPSHCHDPLYILLGTWMDLTVCEHLFCCFSKVFSVFYWIFKHSLGLIIGYIKDIICLLLKSLKNGPYFYFFWEFSSSICKDIKTLSKSIVLKFIFPLQLHQECNTTLLLQGGGKRWEVKWKDCSKLRCLPSISVPEPGGLLQ